ncbi:MAG: ATP-binding cassette domain-containing protein [Enterocloster asparagiformis]|nr:ATP-binding cassette domain-containing protein [Enterocloster asparagiformis]
MDEKKILIQVKNLERLIPLRAGRIGGERPVVHAVDGVTFDIYENETLALVGESGCGKSTLGRTLLKLAEPTGGAVFYRGQNIFALDERELRLMRRNMQMVFQDIGASLNPHMTIEQILMKPLQSFYPEMPNAQVRKRAEELLETVGLSPAEIYRLRYPHEFSGGQRQRIGIARAIALSPGFIVADEPVSALDVSVRGQILNLFNDLKHKMNLTYLFITHDMSVVRSIADRVAVMYLGKIVELADADAFFENPLHPYAQAILSAMPIADPDLSRARQIIDLKGELPSPVNIPGGCRFSTRCQHAVKACSETEPQLTDMGDGHFCACFFAHGSNRGPSGPPAI